MAVTHCGFQAGVLRRRAAAVGLVEDVEAGSAVVVERAGDLAAARDCNAGELLDVEARRDMQQCVVVMTRGVTVGTLPRHARVRKTRGDVAEVVTGREVAA